MIPIGARLWRFRSFYDTMEYKALGGSYDTDPKIVIPMKDRIIWQRHKQGISSRRKSI